MAAPNILTVFLANSADCRDQLKQLASNPNTDFTVSDNVGNIFHACISKNSANRLLAIKAGLGTLKVVNATLNKALNALNNRGETPLYAASKCYASEALNIAKILLELGADPTIPSSKGMLPDERALKCWTSLYIRTPEVYNLLNWAKNEKVGLLGCLKDGNFNLALQRIDSNEDVHQLDCEDNTTMLLAIKGNPNAPFDEDRTLFVLKRLHGKGVNINHQPNKTGPSVLWVAVQKGYVKILDFLLSQTNADITITNFAKETIFHLAAKAKTTDVIELLLNSRAHDLLLRTNCTGQTPLHVVEYPEVCEILCKANPALVTTKDQSQLEPVHYFVGKPYEVQLRSIIERYDHRKELKSIEQSSFDSLKENVSELGKKIEVQKALAEAGKIVVIAATKGTAEATAEFINYGLDLAKSKVTDKKNTDEKKPKDTEEPKPETTS